MVISLAVMAIAVIAVLQFWARAASSRLSDITLKNATEVPKITKEIGTEEFDETPSPLGGLAQTIQGAEKFLQNSHFLSIDETQNVLLPTKKIWESMKAHIMYSWNYFYIYLSREANG